MTSITLLRVFANSGDDRNSDGGGSGTSILTRPEEKVAKAPMYKVLLLNDDYTPMEFVVAVLEEVFMMPREKAISLMLDVHRQGIGVAGVYRHEIAETKAAQVVALARSNEHPLQCTIEKE